MFGASGKNLPRLSPRGRASSRDIAPAFDSSRTPLACSSLPRFTRCVRKESNFRPLSYQDSVLPLNYGRISIEPTYRILASNRDQHLRLYHPPELRTHLLCTGDSNKNRDCPPLSRVYTYSHERGRNLTNIIRTIAAEAHFFAAA